MTRFNGTDCHKLIRLNPDGSADPTFALSECDGEINAIAVQSDGRIVVAGAFANVAGQARHGCARLNIDGSLDNGFQPGGTIGTVWTLAVDLQGRVLVGGEFSDWGGAPAPHANLVRLMPEGTLDGDFKPANVADRQVRSVIMEPDGRIVVAGASDDSRTLIAPRMARLETTGLLDPRFTPLVDTSGDNVFAVVRLPGGGYAIAGSFHALNGQPHWLVARLKPDGLPDPVFDTSIGVAGPCFGTVHTVALDARGGLIIGGYFCELDGRPWSSLARLHNTLPPHVVDPAFTPFGTPFLPTRSVVAWGRNLEEQTNVPLGLSDVSAIAAGHSHSLALRREGTVVAWGNNSVGQATVPTGLSNVTAISAKLHQSVALRRDGSVVAWGQSGQPVPTNLPVVTTIAAGGYHTLALTTNGTVVAWGLNEYKQTNVPAGLTGVVAIAAGERHSVALKNDGTVVAWGWNDYGQTNVPAGLRGVVAIAAAYADTLALKSDGTVVGWGEGPGPVPAGLDNVTAIALGDFHAAALRRDGSITLWGMNGDKQLDVPSNLDSVSAIVAGGYHTLVMTVTGPRVTGVVATPDGGLVAGGVFPTGSEGVLRPGLRRYLVDGSADPTFRPVLEKSVHRLARQPDGRILVSLWDPDDNGFTHPDFVRINHDGSRDLSFAPFAFPNYREPLGRFRVADDGRIYVLTPGEVNAEPYSSRLRRLWPDGAVDRSFSVPLPTTGGAFIEERIRDFALQPDGKVIVVGGFTQLQSRARLRVARLNQDGALDLSFANPSVTGGDEVRLVALQADGKVLIAGNFTNVSGVARSGLARLNSNGTNDPTFKPAVTGTITSLSVEPDGRILLGGAIAVGERRFTIRLNQDGSIDSSFGLGAGPDIPPQRSTRLEVIRASDGAHFVTGDFERYDGQPRTALVRLLPDPTEKRVSAGFSTDEVVVSEADSTVSVKVTRSDDLTTPLRLSYAVTTGSATGGLDFEMVTNTLTLAVGESEKSFVVSLKDDVISEGDEVANLRLSASDGASLTGREQAWMHIRDDELPAGEVDTSFTPSEAGPMIDTDRGGINFINALPDGGVLATGIFNGYGDIADLGNLVRLRADGSADEDWSANVKTDRSFEISPVVQPDGRILLGVGSAVVNGSPRKVLARLNADGTLDTVFRRLNSTLTDPLPNQVALQTNGLIWIAGPLGEVSDGQRTARLTGEGVIRLLADGQLDPEFIPFSVPSGRILGVAPAPGGGAYIVGTFDLLTSGGGRRVARLHPNGELDTTFKPEVRFDTFVSQVVVQPDGRLLIGGNFVGIGADDQLVRVGTLARLFPDGTVDPSFVCHATQTFHWLKLLNDGKILAGGQRMHVGGAYRSGLVRLNADGTLDATFRPDLILAESFDASLYGGDVDSLGRVLVAGALLSANGQSRMGVARLLGVATSTHGQPPPSFHFALSVTNVAEAIGELQLTVIKDRSGAAGVNFATQTGTAGAFDFEATSGFLAFSANETTKTIRIPIFNDFLEETSEAFTVTLSPLNENGTPGEQIVATVTILDDDAGIATRSLLDFRFPGSPPGTTGRLRFEFTPDDIGGGWRFPWESIWRPGGSAADRLEPGNYQIEFKPVAGWHTPLPTVVPVPGGPVTIYPIEYFKAGDTRTGRLTVALDPPSLRSQSRWRLSGESSFRVSGETAENIPEGNQIIEFLPIAGWITPTAREVTISDGLLGEVTASYLLADPLPTGVALPTPLPNLNTIAESVGQSPALPYAFNGQLRTDAGWGSGFVVRERVVLTAAHLVFDDYLLAPVGDADWFPQRHAGEFEPRPLRARGWYEFSGYATQRIAENSPGVATIASHNLDAAALWFTETTWRGGQGGYLLTDETHEWLLPSAGSRQKLLVGYPVDGASLGRADIVPGRMHSIFPANYFFTAPSPQTRATTGFLGFPGNSGGSVNVLHESGRYFPAAIYLGTDAGRSMSRVIDREVADLIGRAASAAEVGTNYNGGGVIRFVSSGSGGAVKLQKLTVILSPPGIIAFAKWKLAGQADARLQTSGQFQTLFAPTNISVTFTPVSGFVTPAPFPVSMKAGQNAILEVTYNAEPAVRPVLTVSSEDGLRVSGPAGTKVRLQYRIALEKGVWADAAGKSIELGATPSRLLTSAEGAATPGFYRIIVVP